MKAKISTAPMAMEIWPAVTASAPSWAPTVCWAITFSGAGRAPDFSSRARLWAESSVKLPVIWPVPAVIALWMVGALMICLSRTMANGLPRFWLVTSAKRRAPTPLKAKLMSGRLSWS